MQVTTIGVDLAKNVFQVHGIAENDDVLFNKPLRRAQFLPFFAKLEPCLIGMESCSSAHHWARELTALGHEVRLIPPMYVKPYVKRGKSDAIDAEAICEAVTRSHPERASKWLTSLLERKPARVATVAMANKTARIVWAVLTRDEPYSPRAAV